jgi:hypothetical protein
MLLVTFRRCAAVAAEPERESETLAGADALSDFAQRTRPPNESHLKGQPNVGGCLYRPITFMAYYVHLRRPTATPLDMAHSRGSWPLDV